MEHKARSIRPFIGSKDFEVSRSFYRDLGFTETVLGKDLSVFETGSNAFYLQNYYNKDWVDNTMVFMEVENVEEFWGQLLALNLTDKYKDVRLVPIKNLEWGRECFVHDPSGVLWHFGAFNK
ncbi:glyoxalase [Flavobacterium sp. Sd200]|uniref:glyoxalase n=1 Tax=Flavobacterium sp. Sd200 TaxID=2692211 RepID=UPI00136A2D0B|nr:glyoxalase [Flavobacterium sp. Sd200]MXN92469.1 glyoxalase [Flavobacterium sp. Sd200]